MQSHATRGTPLHAAAPLSLLLSHHSLAEPHSQPAGVAQGQPLVVTALRRQRLIQESKFSELTGTGRRAEAMLLRTRSYAWRLHRPVGGQQHGLAQSGGLAIGPMSIHRARKQYRPCVRASGTTACMQARAKQDRASSLVSKLRPCYGSCVSQQA